MRIFDRLLVAAGIARVDGQGRKPERWWGLHFRSLSHFAAPCRSPSLFGAPSHPAECGRERRR